MTVWLAAVALLASVCASPVKAADPSPAAADPPSTRAGDPSAVLGAWWTQNHDGVVEIHRCSTGLCGTVVGVTDFAADGAAKTDLHGHSRCHLQIIPDGTIESDGVWDSHITNPEDDRTYTIQLRVDDRGRLRMHGYIGIPLFGQTVYWTRFAGQLTPNCHITN